MLRSFVLSLFCLFFLNPSITLSQPNITGQLQLHLEEGKNQEFIDINITLKEQYDHNILYKNSREIPQGQRRQFVISQLKEFSHYHQATLLSYLEAMQKQGKVKDIQHYWIGNLINCKVAPSVIQDLILRDDLLQIDFNQERQVISLEDLHKETTEVIKNISSTLAWNVWQVKANQVWEKGFTGQGVVVGVLDSGINYHHNDLAGRMWINPEYPNHGYNFVGNNHQTMDYLGHGTHVAGTISGTGLSGTKTGVAPGAKIMAVKVLGNTGSGTEAGVWAGIQFAVEQGADIINLSLGWKYSWNPDRGMWRIVMNNTLSAGVIAAVASGNEGTSGPNAPNQVRTPGDIPPPWTHPDQTLTGGNSAVVSVGSTTNTDALSSFSSKGPSTWSNISPFHDYQFNPGLGLIRPDVSAPGSVITSLAHDNNSSYAVMNGTSMATPAVAGIMALMISKNPELSPEQISQILEESSVSLSSSKSNSFGSGRVDALAAITQTPYMGLYLLEHFLDDYQGNADGKINPGEIILLDLLIENSTFEDFDEIILSFNTNSPFISIVDSIVSVGSFSSGEQKQLNGIFTFEVAANIPGNHIIDFCITAYPQNEVNNRWENRFSEKAFAASLSLTDLVIDDSLHGNNNGRLDPGETASMIFKIINQGDLPSEAIEINIEADNQLITFNTNSFSAPALAAGDHLFAEFLVSVHNSVPMASISRFNLSTLSGPYELMDSFDLKIGLILEDWSTGDFSQFPWQFGGSHDWLIVSDNAYEGSYSAKSGNISHNSFSSLFVQMHVISDDSISFYRKVSSENNYDWLEFWIDNIRLGRWSGQRDWERLSYPVSAGERTFRWVYIKDESMSMGEDCGWIDKIEFPAVALTTAFAGEDSMICGLSKFELNGTASNYDLLFWSTSGDGTFGDTTSLTTWYQPGNDDLVKGQAFLTLNAGIGQVILATDSMSLYVFPQPEVDLGGDQMVCNNSTLLLDAGIGHYSYLWFDGSNLQTYLVDPENFQDQAEIWVVVTSHQGCIGSDSIIVSFDECLYINYIQGPTSLTVFPNPTNNAFMATWYNSHPSPSTLKIFSLSGKMILKHTVEEKQGWNSYEFKNLSLKAGTYLLKIESNGHVATQKVIIQ
jgi:hypothetical protein